MEARIETYSAELSSSSDRSQKAPSRIWILAAALAAALLLPVLVPFQAAAGVFEVSAGFSYDRNNYGDDSYAWSRRLGATFGFHFTERSGIELSFQDVMDRTKISGFEDTTFHDKIYSANWIQALTGKDFPIQPFVKAGIGQLNREATGSYAGGGAPPAIVDSLTAVAGAGLRLYFTRALAIRSEATTYLTGGRISTYKDNVAVTVGLSLYF